METWREGGGKSEKGRWELKEKGVGTERKGVGTERKGSGNWEQGGRN